MCLTIFFLKLSEGLHGSTFMDCKQLNVESNGRICATISPEANFDPIQCRRKFFLKDSLALRDRALVHALVYNFKSVQGSRVFTKYVNPSPLLLPNVLLDPNPGILVALMNETQVLIRVNSEQLLFPYRKRQGRALPPFLLAEAMPFQESLAVPVIIPKENVLELKFQTKDH